MDGRRFEQAWLNKQRPDRALPLGELVGRLWRAQVGAGARQLGAVRQAWLEVVPDQLRSHSRVARLRGGQLRVAVDSAGTRYLIEAVMHDQLVSSLNATLGRPTVRRIRCELGLPEPEGEA